MKHNTVKLRFRLRGGRNVCIPFTTTRGERPSVVLHFRQYADNALRDRVVCKRRYDHIRVVSDKLERFLATKGLSSITAAEFTPSLLMEFRDFILHEYRYAERHPGLYKHLNQHNRPKARLSLNTAATQMKMLQAFFTELEDSDEILKSPFRSLGKQRKQLILKTKYDIPVFLRDNEFQAILATGFSSELQDTRDAFLVQCALGCRISDFVRLDMRNISVSSEGIPYVHYLPRKTADTQMDNREVETPLVRYAFDIIRRTGFKFPILKNIYGARGYNKKIKFLLEVCGINREVPVFNEETSQNDYLPLFKTGSSKLARKTHVDMMNKVQINLYAAGLHKEGSTAVHRYTNLELKDRFALMNAAFGQKPYKVDANLDIIQEG